MKRLSILTCFLVVFTSAIMAQSVAINTTGTAANGSSILDVSSTTKGFLLPRMTGAQRLAIVSPVTGLQVFQTNDIVNNPAGFYFFNGTSWVSFAAGSAGNANSWALDGNTNTNPATNYVGTSNFVDLRLATNNTGRMIIKSTGEVGIGTNSPAGILGLARGNINTNQPILRMDDGSTTNTSASMLLFNLGNNTLIDGSTLGTGTMMRLNRDGTGGSGEGLRVNNKGDGAAVHAVSTGGIAVLGTATSGVGGRFESNFTGLQAFGNGAASFTSTGNEDAVTLKMTGNSNSVQSVNSIQIAMTNTGTAPVVGIDVSAKSNTSGVQVVGMLSRPVGTGAASVACFIGTGDMSISGQYLITSDQKLKKNIQPMPNMMNKIMQLSPSNYLYRSDEYKMNLPKNEQHGLIAQELQSVFPELVTQQIVPASYDNDKKTIDEEVKYLAVNYIGLIPVLIKGIQEQEGKIWVLQTENTQLKKDLAMIKAKLGL